MKSIKRKGFTLVELLIVIVVIGILSAMMMMSSTEAVTSAKASNVVSNLRNLKTAALAYYVDSMDYVSNLTNTTKPSGFSGDIAKYLTDDKKLNEPGYDAIITAGGEWYVTYDVQGSETEKTGIRSKLKGRAKSIGLLKAPADTQAGTYNKTANVYDGGDGKVALFVR
ncbi:MAG: prepilin-type N-terminal cleavage/methylation domain-containing protein [Synergistaceae bacterium]|nr:prepilin-type N-terminal cleavage/methylation domain-containing protein [Synergistaceae bacterium]